MAFRWVMAGMAGMFIAVAAGGCGSSAQHENFSPWMAGNDFEKWSKKNVDGQPVYVCALEGRNHDGQDQYRAKLHPAPQNAEWYWYWWYSTDKKFFLEQTTKLVNQEHFDLIGAQSFYDKYGRSQYQMIFLKVVRKSDDGK
jgi:hypothetical protein